MPASVVGVTSSDPGTIGLEADDRTLMLLRFDDDSARLMPVDDAGNLEPMQHTQLAAGIFAEPVDAYTGRGRLTLWDDLVGFIAADAVDGDTLSTRDVTIQAFASMFDGDQTYPMCLMARGISGSSSERYAYGLEINYVGAGPVLEMRMFWQTEAGVLKTQTGAEFFHPSPGDASVETCPFVMLTATRRWISTTEVVVRYFVNDQMIGEVTSVDGDIGGGTTGHTTIGCRGAGAGAYDRGWAGVIDQVKVADYEMSPDEVRATWQRIVVHQPAAVEMVTAMAPPGSGWGRTQPLLAKVIRVGSTGLGYALAKAEELRENWLPDRAYDEGTARWERTIGLARKPLDSLDQRRARVGSFLARENGYAAPQIQEALAEPFDVDVADVEILGFTNETRDAFAALEAERWTVEPVGVWSVAAGVLGGTIAGGSDLRVTSDIRNHCRARTRLSSGSGRVVFVGKISSLTVGSDRMAAMLLCNGRTNNALWIGEWFTASRQFGYASLVDGVASPFTLLQDFAGGYPGPGPIWWRIVKDPDVPGRYVVGWSTTSETSGYTEFTLTGQLTDPEWAGFSLLGNDSSTGGSTGISVDEAVVYTPNGNRPLYWYAYRDPLLPGEPDMAGADLLARKIRPAHTHGAAIQSRSVLCDDTVDGACDRGPCGGI